MYTILHLHCGAYNSVVGSVGRRDNGRGGLFAVLNRVVKTLLFLWHSGSTEVFDGV